MIGKKEEAVHDIATGQVGALARCHEHTFINFILSKDELEDLERIEKWLLDYDGSEYALVEIRNLIKALRAKSTEAIIRYDNRVKSFSK